MTLLTFPGGYGGLLHSDQDHVTLSCCIRRDTLQKVRRGHSELSAGDAVLRYITASSVGARSAFAVAERENTWLAVGPIRPGIRRCYNNGVFYVGNMAGESHPIIAEGISMAMQSGWLLAQSLLSQASMSRQELESVGYLYSKKWRAQFSNRIRAAALFTQMTTRPQTMSLVLPLVERFPKLLTFGATLSGKAKELVPPLIISAK
jgi:flavin-dependent dehydrogenase